METGARGQLIRCKSFKLNYARMHESSLFRRRKVSKHDILQPSPPFLPNSSYCCLLFDSEKGKIQVLSCIELG